MSYFCRTSAREDLERRQRTPTNDRTAVRRMVKRAMDISVALLALILLSPGVLAAAGLIRIRMGRPVLFRQIRPGLNRQPFVLYKLRTMTSGVDPSGRLLSDGSRLNRLGLILRRTSLDEVPQLVNVLQGRMSIVGPRPLLTRYLPYFTERESVRFLVRPGLTGWAQLHGRNLVAWDDRLELDVWYVENWTPWLDLKIMFATLRQLVSGGGVLVDANTAMANLDEERVGRSASGAEGRFS